MGCAGACRGRGGGGHGSFEEAEGPVHCGSDGRGGQSGVGRRTTGWCRGVLCAPDLAGWGGGQMRID